MLPAVSSQHVRHWCQWGATLLGQRSLILWDGHESVSRRGDSQQQGGRERGWHGKVNRREGLRTVVMGDTRKMLTRLHHQGRDQAPVVTRHRSQRRHPRRSSPPSPVQGHRRNVGSPSSSREGKRPVRYAEGMAGQRGWSKRRLLGNAAERDDLIPHESGLTSIGCLVTSKGAVHTP